MTEEDPNFLLKMLTLRPEKTYVPTFIQREGQDDGSSSGEWLGTYNSSSEKASPLGSPLKDESPHMGRVEADEEAVEPDFAEISPAKLEEIPDDSLMEQEEVQQDDEAEVPEEEA